jgi:hypothetical protein
MGTVDHRIASRDARAREGDVPGRRGDVHALSVRLDHTQYRRLRRFATGHEARTGERITHQAILQNALAEYLERHAPPPS